MAPKPYPQTDSDEVKAITVFEDTVDLKFVKSHIQKRSTTPNNDGFLELVDEFGKPIGKLDVQMKKIPDGQTSYSCESELVSYSETIPALILICVDISNRNVFWKQIYKSMPEFKPDQKTFTVHFSHNSDLVDSTDIYLQKWREIVYNYRERLSKYSDLNDIVKNKLNLSGLQPSDCSFFQRFIDTINNLFDIDFIAVKDLIFPGQWKLGVSTSPSDDKILHYQIYTIPYGYPSPLITKLDKPYAFNNKFNSNTVSETMSQKEGETDPIKMGKHFVLDEVSKIAEQKTFPIFGTASAQELVLAFIDLYHICLGLTPYLKQYSIEEVDYAMNQYLFNIATRSFKYVKRRFNTNDAIDLNALSTYLSKSTPPQIDPKDVIPPFFIVSNGFPIRLAFESLQFLKVKKTANISRIFGLPDVDLSIKNGPFYIWSRYSLENESASVTRVLNSSLEEYKTFIEGNRLRFANSSYLDTNTSIIFEYEPAYLSPISKHPVLDEYHVVNYNRNLPKLNVIIKDPKSNSLDATQMHKVSSIMLDGITYSCDYCSLSDAGFLFNRTPIINLVYRMLYSDLNKHYGIQVHDRVTF